MTSAVAVASTRSCTDAVNDPQRLRVRWVPAHSISEAAVKFAQEEIEAIWNRYHVEIVWEGRWASESGTEIPDLFIQFVDGPAPTKRHNALAWIPFADGRPLPYARVSRPAALRLLATKSWFDDIRLQHAALDVQAMALGRAIGRALAHEIGHFLMASRAHASDGLMRASIDPGILTHPGRAFFKLEPSAQRMLRAARLASCELEQARK